MWVTAFYEGITAVSQNAVLLKPMASGQTRGRPFDRPNAVLYKFRIILKFDDKADP
jgi:hypothetical protein